MNILATDADQRPCLVFAILEIALLMRGETGAKMARDVFTESAGLVQGKYQRKEPL